MLITRVEDLTKFEGECPIIVVFSTYMDIRIPLTKKWKKIINEKEDKPNTYHNNLIDYISGQVESGESKFLVFDEMSDKISTKYGDDTIIGRIGGIFYDFLAKRNERREAFGGRKFDVVLDNGEVEKCEGQWWDAVTDRAREELEKEGNPFSKMMLIGVSSVDRLLDCYVYCGLWASESKIKEMIAEYKGRIYEYYEFKEEVINKINETRRKLYIQSWEEQLIRSGMRQKRKDVFESPDGLYIEMVYENKAFVSYRPIKETQDLPIDAKYIPLLTRIFGENILAEIGGGKIFITTGKYAVNFWCWGK